MPSDSDDVGYDSEEERLQARLSYHRHEQSLLRERARQAMLLRDYQARQQTRQQLEEDLTRRRLQQEGHFQAEANSEPSWRQGQRGEPPPAALPLSTVEAHEQRWARLEQGAAAATTLTYADIPWPPVECATTYLHGLIHLEAGRAAARATAGGGAAGGDWHPQQQQQRRGRQASRPGKRAYAKACLRWHPDKFLHRFGRVLAEGQRDRILERVQAISQGINRAWEEARQEWEWEEGG